MGILLAYVLTCMAIAILWILAVFSWFSVAIGWETHTIISR